MAILTKIFTLFRGTATEAGQAVVDANALRILDQEIRDAQKGLLASRDDLTRLMAQRKLAADKREDKRAKHHEYSGYVEQLLVKGDRALATEVAGKIATLEGDLADEDKIIGDYDANIAKLHAAIRKAEATIGRLKQQVDTVKATESVQRAQSSIALRSSGTNASLRTAVDSLDRIKQRQLERAAQIDAAEQLEDSSGDNDLQRKLADAGITPGAASVESILARFERAPTAALTHDSAPQLAAPVAVRVEAGKA